MASSTETVIGYSTAKTHWCDRWLVTDAPAPLLSRKYFIAEHYFLLSSFLKLCPNVIWFLCQPSHRVSLLAGFMAFVVSVTSFGALLFFKYPVTILYDKFLPFMTSSIIVSVILSILVYIKARTAPNHALATGGNSGRPPCVIQIYPCFFILIFL